MTWEDVLKEEFEQHEEWTSNDRQATGEARLDINNEGDSRWEIVDFGLVDESSRGKGLGQAYLENFLVFLEKKRKTNGMPMVIQAAQDALGFWERMEEEGLVVA